MARDLLANPGSTPFLGDSEMADLMRTVDWSATPIGSPDRWPQSLRTSLSICLESRFPILLWWGPQLVMLYNDAYRLILGDKHPASMGMEGAVCWPEIWDIIGPMLRGVLEQGVATWSEDQLLFLNRHGYPEECYFTFSYSPIRDEGGAVGGVFCAVTETTSQVLRERRLRLLRALAVEARTAEEAAGEALAVMAQDPHDLPFALFYRHGARAQELVTTAPASIRDHAAPRPPASLGSGPEPMLIDDLAALLAAPPADPWGTEPVQAIALPIDHPGSDDPWGTLVLGLAPRLAFDREYEDFARLVASSLATALTNADAAEAVRRRADALAELDRAKTTFFTNISHEFRTPLTLLLGPLHELAADERLDDATRDRLELAHRNAVRLLRLVNALLEFSRIEAGRADARVEPVELGALTRQLASMFETAFVAAGVALEIDVEALPAPVRVDPDMWERIVLNLVSNAFKHTYEGSVRVGLSAEPGWAVLTVEDTGVGIPADELPRVFERFHRVQSPAARTHEGTGIGLALAQELLKLHGGSIEAFSELGRGSRFVARIPLESAIEPAARPVGSSQAARSGRSAGRALVDEALGWLAGLERPPVAVPSGPGRADPRSGSDGAPGPHAPKAARSDEARRDALVLYADDNADMRRYVAGLLAPEFEVVTAVDGEDALGLVRTQRPDLVIADVMMPRLDGFGLVERLRADEATSTLPIILLSARAGEEAAVEGLRAGADDYVVKPFSAETLRARVAAHLATARLREQSVEGLHAALAELREREEQLRRALAAKDEFLGMVSHELRTPLTTILGNATVLARRARSHGDGSNGEVLADIAGEAERLNDVIENLLVLARLETGQSLDLEPVLLERLVGRVIATHDRTHEGPPFELRGCERQILVDAHADSLEQILVNLLSNARKYSPPDRPIEVSCDADGEWAEIRVADRGVGVDPTETEAIFAPFYRSPRTAHRSGLGIGLSVCRRLAEAMGARLTAEPREGGGSVFRVRLPVTPDEGSPARVAH